MGRSRVRKTTEQFIMELYAANPNIAVLGTYIGAREPILVKCKIDGYEWHATPDNLLRGKGCKMCARKHNSESKRKHFTEIQMAFAERGLRLLTTEDEINSLAEDRLRYICPVHGEQIILWGNFAKGAGCRLCADEANGVRQRKETWARIIAYFQNSEYELLSNFDEYTGAKDSCLRCNCKKHGEFKISWNNLNKYEGCPVCNASAGERKIFHYLKACGIAFEHPYRFNDLIGVGGKKLSYDFFVPSQNVLIEYQGEQHEKPARFNNIELNVAEVNLLRQLEHDRRKRQYAEQHQYRLLEIWYYDFKNVEDILFNNLTIQN